MSTNTAETPETAEAPESPASKPRRAALRPARSPEAGRLSPLVVPPPMPLDSAPDSSPPRRRGATPRPAAPKPPASPKPPRAAAKPAPAAPRPDPAPKPDPPVDKDDQPPTRGGGRAGLLPLGGVRARSLNGSNGAGSAPDPARASDSAPAPDPPPAPAAESEPEAADSAEPRSSASGNGGRVALSPRQAPRQATLMTTSQPRSHRRFWSRERPFHSAWRCWAIGLLSLASVALLIAYLAIPAGNVVCAGQCTPNRTLTLAYGAITSTTIAITLYFLTLYAIGLARSRRPQREAPAAAGAPPLYVLVTPAHNEALVIAETVRCMLRLRGRFLVVIVDDGSSDDTGAIARRAGGADERLIVLTRSAEVAGQGKGEVLNAAYREICRMVDEADPRLGGAAEDDVIMCIVDADGWLRGDALEAVAPYFDDPKVAGVQVPVRMYNARRGLLACMQDIEFIGFSVLIQGGRDRLGSALLGGNGQFVRLAALRTLGDAPWTRALTEDLDIGLRLVRAGWVNRVCVETCVAQQAVTRLRPLLRQRTRWVQGHYSCWSHLPALWRTPGIRFRTRLDLSLHLLLAATILIVTVQALMGIGGFLGVLPLGRIPLANLVGNDTVYRACVLIAACGPLGMLGLAYQRAAVDYQASLRRRLPWWSLPGVFFLFTLYVYCWGLPSTFRAFGRLALGRGSWAKTAREPLSAQHAAAEPQAAVA